MTMAGAASVRQRAQIAGYLKTGDDFSFMGTGFTQLDDSPAAATKQKRYINMGYGKMNCGADIICAYTAPPLPV